jgi:hypothetical protein
MLVAGEGFDATRWKMGIRCLSRSNESDNLEMALSLMSLAPLRRGSMTRSSIGSLQKGRDRNERCSGQ